MANLLGVVHPCFEHQVDGGLAFLGRDMEALRGFSGREW